MAIVALDIETTGLEKTTCRITQISLVKFDLCGISYKVYDAFDSYVNPGPDIEWSEFAQTKTGITPETVKDAPAFADIAEKIRDFIGDCDVLTYNGNAFDLPILKYEFARTGKPLVLYGKKIYDSLYIESKLNSRKLTDVYKRYTGKDLDDAHNSMADTMATVEVFSKQHTLLNDDFSGLELDTNCNGLIGTLEGGKCFLQGKYKGIPVKTVMQKDPSYITYFVKQGDPDFYLLVKDIYKELKSESNMLS